MTFPLFPPQASTTATQVDHLYFFLIAVSVFILALVFVPMLYCLFKYRRGHPADRTPPRLPTMPIEITWTVIPLVLSMGMFAWGAHVYYDLEVPPADALEINVVGKQWMWKVQHQSGHREINELHIPVGRTVKLTLASQDVIHDFFVPAFRVKQDVVPGRFVTAWFRPTRMGRYHLFCSQYCGTDHSKMTGTIYVMRPEDYQDWLSRGGAGDTLAQSGARLFRTLGCSGCHEGNGAVRAPRLEGLYGKLVPLQDKQIVRADDKYIRDSILLPASQIVAGYEPLMPTFQGHISEEELFQLIAYIKSLANQTPAPVASGNPQAKGAPR
jgi:cytochrome c oxidase subunit 2